MSVTTHSKIGTEEFHEKKKDYKKKYIKEKRWKRE